MQGLETFGVGIGVLAGLLLPIQTCLNSRLRESVGSPFLSSLISFIGGTVFLFIVTLCVNGSVLFPLSAFAQNPAWLWLGGLFGVIGLTTNIFIFPKIGGVQTAILPITGQIIMGLIIDTFGLFYSAQQTLNITRLLGILLVIAGVVGAVVLGQKRSHKNLPSDSSPSDEQDAGLLGWRALALGAGFLMAAQSAINGHLGVVLGSSAKSAFVSFTVGTIVLALIACVLKLKIRIRVPQGKTKNPWWMYFGGVLGALFVAGNALLVPVLGTGLTIMAALTGMITGSLMVDKFGLLQAPQRAVTLTQVLSLGVMVIGIALVRLT